MNRARARSHAVCCEYQPIVDISVSGSLTDLRVVGYEALARLSDTNGGVVAPVDMTLREGVPDLDRACRLAALRGALDAGIGNAGCLFVNVEPASGDLVPVSTEEQRLYDQASRSLRVFIEITERALLDNPADVLRQVGRARQYGWGVAVDDVGANPDSLAMLPFIAPDVIKLDLALVRRTPSRDQARVITAVMAHAERTGAVVLAEGVETAAQLEQARSYGATLGQGWLFGRPGPLVAGPLPS